MGGQNPLAVGKQSTGLAQARAVQGVAHAAGVGKLRLGNAQAQVLLEGLERAGTKAVVLLFQGFAGDVQQLGHRIVGKVQVVGDARTHAGVGLEEGFHAVVVAGQNDHQVFALVFHHLQQDFDGLLAIVALVLGAVQVVGLVNEQHAAHGALQNLFGLGRGVAYVLAHQVVPRDGDQVPFAHVAQAMQDLRHAHGHRGFASAGVAAKAHVQTRRLAGQAQVDAQFVDDQQRSNVPNARLDRHQPHQVGVQLCQHRLHLRALQHLAHRAGLRRGAGCRIGGLGHAGSDLQGGCAARNGVRGCVHGETERECGRT